MKAPAIALACLILLAGCATGPAPVDRSEESLPPAPELRATPFFPQQQYQCGPAALATVLGASEVAVTPEELAPAVYLPGRRGSLQTELLGAARRYGRIPYPAGQTLEQLASHLRDRRPVLVLQNLGFRRFPIWHYAVVIGFEPEQDQVILRSGTHRRHLMSRTAFLTSWERADRWAIALLAPGEMPLDATEPAYLRAVAGLEAAGQHKLARISYEAALTAWPESETALLGIAFSDFQLGRHRDAERALRVLVARNPGHAIAWNNLAELLHQSGCRGQALTAIQNAILVGPPELQNDLLATRSGIQTGPVAEQQPQHCAPVPTID